MPDKPGGNLDALFRQARRSSGSRRTRTVTGTEGAPADRADSAKGPVAAADDRTRLVLIEGRDGRFRYTLDGEEVRVGDALEVFVNGSNGWLYGTFQWTGRERHAPSLKVELRAPGQPDQFVGTLDATLPKHARVRRA
jgi:hypothetical protein